MEPIEGKNWLFLDSGCLSPRAVDAYIKCELPGDLQIEVENHLKSCELCRDAVEGYSLGKNGLVNFESLIDKRLEKGIHDAAISKNTWSRLYPVLAFAAILVLFIGIYLIIRYQLPHKQRLTANNDQSLMYELAPPAEKAVTMNKESGKFDAYCSEDTLKKEVKKNVPEQNGLMLVNVHDSVVLMNNDDLSSADIVVSEDHFAVDEKVEEVDSNYVYSVVEEMASYQGGHEAMLKFLNENINYPENAKESSVEGTVYVGFIIDENGKLGDIKVLRGIGNGCDEEAIRIVKLMPVWKPGRQAGKAVKVQYTLPVRFKLND